MPMLRRADCTGPGIARRRAGRGFTYTDVRGRRVADPETLARIRALVIPPAWIDVWICPFANGHIQATGLDVRGRRQYRYHDAWRVRRDQEKFDHMLDFARALPLLRERCHALVAGRGYSRDRVLACATRLLDLGFFRIGSEDYAEENQSYGLATIRRSHVSLSGDVVTFDYRAKSGKRRIQSVVDPDVARLIRALKARTEGGPELLAYKRRGEWRDVRSGDINEFIKELSGGEFTAKDFRTWSATVLTSVGLAVSTRAATPAARRRAVTRAVTEAAHYLGNTPIVCRKSYVDPRVIDAYLTDGQTIHRSLDRLGEGVAFGHLSTQGPIERAVLELLQGASDAAEQPETADAA